MSRVFLLSLLIIFSSLSVSAAAADVPASGLPKRVFSVSESNTFEKDTGGPLFKKMKAALAAANSGDALAFSKFVKKGAKLELFWFANEKIETMPLSIKVIQAAAASCLGPYPYVETTQWVQLSWVCHTKKETKLSQYLTFRHSPELSMTVWFKDGLIQELIANEPLQVPGQKMLTMDAAPWLEKSQASALSPVSSSKAEAKKGFDDPRDYFRRAKHIVDSAIAGDDREVSSLIWPDSKIKFELDRPSLSRTFDLDAPNIRLLLSGCKRDGQIEVDNTGTTMSFVCSNQQLTGRYRVTFEYYGQKVMIAFIAKHDDKPGDASVKAGDNG